MIDIPTTVPKEILDKYNPVRNSFVVKDTGDINNKFETEIGDILQDDFQPQVKLKRWDNECNFSVRLIDDDKSKGKVVLDGNKIKFVKNKKECHFYQIDKGYEFEVILNEKPKSNLVQMSIETKGLKFYYQPELTQKEKDDGAFRPENIIGSYAVYHSEKQGDYSKMDGKNYRAGKAFHIYRPLIIDNLGAEVWGSLNIDIENKLLTVEIPQSFLDNAVYPVRHASGLEFGYHPGSIGASKLYCSADHYYGGEYTVASSGAIDSVIAYVDGFGNDYFKGIVTDTSGNFLTNGVSPSSEEIVDGDPAWRTANYSTKPSVTGSTDYRLWILNNSSYYLWYDSNGGITAYYENDSGTYTNPSDPTNPSTYSDRQFYIYATYTASGEEEDIKTVNGLALASVKTYNGLAIASVKTINGLTTS